MKKHAWIIGGLAAVAAVCAALQDRAGTAASNSFASASELVQLVQETRIRLVDQKPALGAAEAAGLLDSLENKIDQAWSGTTK